MTDAWIPEQRLAELGIVLPQPFPPAGSYVPVRRHQQVAYVAGHGPWGADPSVAVLGKVGQDLTVAEGQAAARVAGLNVLATLRTECGSLDQVTGILRLTGFVNCSPGFNQTPQVLDGCSELFTEIFGAAGRHARSAIGVAELPFNVAVIVEVTAALG